jgi:hypothetical protein
MILRPRRRLKLLERKLDDVELVIDALAPPPGPGGSRKPKVARTLLRASLLKLAESTLFLDQEDEIVRGACSVRLERKQR